VRTPCLLLAALALILTPHSASAAAARQDEPPDPMFDCSECHTCGVPTAREPCLKACPRSQMVHQVARHDLREAPGVLLLGELVDLYQPVEFDHKGHAGMAEMGLECATCHHFSPPGKVPPCRDCHEPNGRGTDLTKPNLKGAFHRQCLACHREWSHDTKCVVCHAPSEQAKLATASPDPTDIVGTSHPVIAIPTTRVFETPYEAGPVVTFQHNEHVALFGFRCADCHRDESCANCHDLTAVRRPVRTDQEVHAICTECHVQDDCAKCHDTSERPGFTHNRTGWPLAAYHERLDCWSCHPKGKRMGRINTMCRSCHADWSPETFKHAVTGLVLDETHTGVDCDACHPDHGYDGTPTCDVCHDDGRTANSAPPGARLSHPKGAGSPARRSPK
jgi:hypothetical protein